MSTRLLTLSQKTGEARFFFNLHCFIHFAVILGQVSLFHLVPYFPLLKLILLIIV